MVSWNIAALVGVPGVGKTSLCRSAAGALGYRYVNYGELMLDVAMYHDLASTQDDMFKLDLEIQQSIWENAALEILEMKKNSTNILLDLHGIDRSDLGYLVSLPIEIISPDIILVVESSYENIITRRYTDKSRQRCMEGLKSVGEHMQMLRMSMMACSIICGSYLKVLDNDDFEKCLNELNHVLCK